MLKKRLLTTLWGLPVTIAAIWFGDPWFTSLIAICGLLGGWEFYRMAAAKAAPLTYLGLVWIFLFILSPHFSNLTPLLLTSGMVLSLIWLVLRRRREGAFTGWALTIAGILYIGWLLSHLVTLRTMNDGKSWVFLVLLTTFASDSAAYFIGGTWG